MEILPDAPIEGDGSFSFRDVPCQACGHKADYRLQELQRLRAQDDVPLDETRH
jgi:hypothetical protein